MKDVEGRGVGSIEGVTVGRSETVGAMDGVSVGSSLGAELMVGWAVGAIYRLR
jgi:hypothetical protein